MAKAQQVKYRAATDDPQRWLANVLRVRFNEVLRYRDAALDPARTDGVHDMRVAIRRLRSAIRDFAQIADKFPLRSLRKSLKRLADSLGAARDADVLITELERVLPDTDEGPIRDGLAAIITEYIEKRKEAHAALEKTLSDKFAADLRTRFSTAMDASLRQRGLFQVSSVREAGGRIVSKCLDDFLVLGEAIYFPSSVQRLHRLRIAGKHVRYAIELFAEPFGEALEPFSEETKKMQSRLGEVHDYDLWIGTLQARLSDKKRKADNGSPERVVAMWLISHLIRRRTKAYRSALDLWTEWESTEFNQRLSDVLTRTAAS